MTGSSSSSHYRQAGGLSNQILPLAQVSMESHWIARGWNLISVPTGVVDSSETDLFPSAVSDAFRYTGSYQSTRSLHSGSGYWIKYATRAQVTLTGTSEYSAT